MKSETPSNPDRERRLDEVVTAYLKAMEAGENPQPAQRLQRYPDLAEELRSFFAAQLQIVGMAGPLPNRDEQSPGLETIGLEGAPRESNLGTVRYVGDYELLEEIARGGMGVVYKARQVSLNRVVALKMILAGQLASKGDVQRFKAEAEAAGKLDHPNIVPIYEVGEHEGQQYFSMKLIETEPRPPRSGPTSQANTKSRSITVAARLTKVARAVHHAHQRGILHRDLKPSNILIDANGEPHVADFGLAKKVEGGGDATKPDAIVGTPAYMAPEQARAEKSLTTAVDVYSLGAILYEWLTGRPPFVGPDVVSVLLKLQTEEPPKPRSVETSIDRDLETICLKCLEKGPTSRYGSADALARDLERWCQGEPIEARPVGQFERGWRWCRRNPAVAGLLAAVVSSLLIGTVVSSYFAWESGQNAELFRTEAILASKNAERASRNEEAALKSEAAAQDNARQIKEREKQTLAALEEVKLQKKTADDNRMRVEWQVYANSIALAQASWNNDNASAALNYLDQCRWDFRGWEHDYLYTLFHANHQNISISSATPPGASRLV